ncbi:MAG: hypothetical protein M3Q22_12410 [Actinomycetota bacterium]|nr:hypothetical protein [Actinomycetota bacterium]
MGDIWLADAHRRIAHAEHAVERKMMGQPEAVPDPEHMRRRARVVSENARQHEKTAGRIEQRAQR